MFLFALTISFFLGQCQCQSQEPNSLSRPNLSPIAALSLRDDLIDPKELKGAPSDLDIIRKKILEPGTPRGIPFKSIKGPKSKQSKIGVVGAGPTGVHMAWSLKEMGYSDVTIMEKSNRIGGKSISYKARGFNQILTTGWWDEEYYATVVPLFVRFGMLDKTSYESVDLSTIIEWPTNDDSIPSNPITMYEIRWLKEQLGLTNPLLASSKLLQDVVKYINLHHKLFGKYEGSLMRRPDNDSMQLLFGSVLNFLERHEMISLTPLFRILFSLFGIGTIEEMPAIYALIWATPLGLTDLLAQRKVNFFRNRTIDELFPLMVRDQDIPVIFDYEVIAIDQSCEKNDCSFTLQGSNGQEDEFDFLIWAGLPSELPRILSKDSPSKQDLKGMFDSIHHHYATLSVVEMSNVVRHGEMQIFSTQLEADRFNNLPMRDYDSYAASARISRQDYIDKNFVYADGSFGKYTFSVSQFSDSNPALEQTKKSLMDHYAGFGATDIEFLHVLTVPTDPRWNTTDTAKGLHWDMYDQQGQNNVWVLGGAFSFESFNAIFDYNQRLLKNMQ